MKRALVFMMALGIILGCQGTPRYGGGRYSDEGDKIAEKQSQAQSQQQSPQAPAGVRIPLLLDNESWSFHYTPDVRYGREKLYQAFQLHTHHLHRYELKVP